MFKQTTKTIISGSFLALVMAISFASSAVSATPLLFGSQNDPGGGGALTTSEKKACRDKWASFVYIPSTDSSNRQKKQKYNSFADDKCNTANGGICTQKTQNGSVDESGNRILTHTFDCSNQSDTSGSKSGGSCSTPSDPGCTITDPALTSGGCDGQNCSFVSKYINPTIKLLSALVGIVAVIFIIFGSIQISTSAGDPQKAANGKNHIRNAVIGLIGYVLLFALINWLVPGGIV